MFLVHVESRRNVPVVLAKSFTVFRICLDDHDRFPDDVCHQHVDLAADFEHLPVETKGVDDFSPRQLLDPVACLLLQRVTVQGAPPEVIDMNLTGMNEGIPVCGPRYRRVFAGTGARAEG